MNTPTYFSDLISTVPPKRIRCEGKQATAVITGVTRWDIHSAVSEKRSVTFAADVSQSKPFQSSQMSLL